MMNRTSDHPQFSFCFGLDVWVGFVEVGFVVGAEVTGGWVVVGLTDGEILLAAITVTDAS